MAGGRYSTWRESGRGFAAQRDPVAFNDAAVGDADFGRVVADQCIAINPRVLARLDAAVAVTGDRGVLHRAVIPNQNAFHAAVQCLHILHRGESARDADRTRESFYDAVSDGHVVY